MFMKLKDGKIVNLLDVRLVKPFDAVAAAPALPDIIAMEKSIEREKQQWLDGGWKPSLANDWAEDQRQDAFKKAACERHTREAFIEKHARFHAEIEFTAAAVGLHGQSKTKTMKIEETPEEFLQSANRQMLEAGLLPHLKQ